ncbi:MAG: 16S rRNA (guanine(966)-N(2))-methyltransferase RsmD [Gemmatimonadetes bacterium]|nr:16S rRNA (guanine(966)-N(2))-methyltransferase RsmD [Gemmatimonadota bacterium]
MRVIAGTLRGRRLVAPEGQATRPTSDRARESLFNLLGPIRAGTRVLDLYAGSGALGIEALSRGAAFAQFVERARPAIAAIRRNVEALGLSDRALILAVDARSDAAFDGGPFDLVLADPPWPDRRDEEIVERAERALAPGGILVLEHPAARPAPGAPTGRELWKSRKYGDTALSLYRSSPDA